VSKDAPKAEPKDQRHADREAELARQQEVIDAVAKSNKATKS
jgi:hypothetical protein